MRSKAAIQKCLSYILSFSMLLSCAVPSTSALASQVKDSGEEFVEEVDSGSVGYAIEATDELTNVLAGAQAFAKVTATGEDSIPDSNRKMDFAVDGKKSKAADYGNFGKDVKSVPNESAYAQFDMGKAYAIQSMNLWRYWDDSRVYGATVIVLSNDADFKKENEHKIIYNSDKNNVHGWGAGSDALYVETASGKNFSIAAESGGTYKKFQYVRIYGYGKATSVSDITPVASNNHIVEIEAFADVAPAAKAFQNAADFLKLKAYYNDPNHDSDQVTHPDVIFFNEKWNGYQYWMAYTPNVMKTSIYENPSVMASNDGKNWVIPEGLENPIEPEPASTRYHNCDADMIYNPKTQELMLYWNWADDNGGGVGAEVRVRTSKDGVHWSDAKTAVQSYNRYDMLSPTIVYDSYREAFFMWANNAGDKGYFNGDPSDNNVRMFYSEDGLTWSDPIRVNNFLGKDPSGAQLAPWHQDIQYIPELREFWAVSQCFNNKASPDVSVLHLTKSKDGVNWEQVGTQPLLSPGKAGSWDDFQIYRSTFMYDNPSAEYGKGTFRIWYSALQDPVPAGHGKDDTRLWHIGYTENSYENVMTALLQEETYTEPALIAADSLTLKSDSTTVISGGSANLSASFEPVDASDQIVKYTSSNPSVLKVDPVGRLTGIKPGKATVTGETQEGTTADIEITVLEEAEIPALRHTIDREHPLYLENYYWSDDFAGDTGDKKDPNDPDYESSRADSPEMLWNTVPDSLKENTVILLIAEQSLKNQASVTDWIKKNVALCNEKKIPVAIQVANGETTADKLIPMSFWEELARDNEYVVGYNAAELYNSELWRQESRAQYITDILNVCVKNGMHLMWTDTNYFAGEQGSVLRWLEQRPQLGESMRAHKQNVVMMYKESYADPDTDALYLGMWLTEYCDNWGIASDWWHWQLDGSQGLFGKYNLQDGGWSPCLVWPEVMYVQDMVRAMSQGATCFKSEAQWYSNATQGKRTPAYQYAIIPFLEKVVNGDLHIPSREEVLERTKAVAVSRSAWPNFNYDYTYSNLYPKTARYGLIPMVPSNTPKAQLNKFEHVFTKKPTQAEFDAIYPEKTKGTAWCENFGDTWYFMNSSENKDVEQNTIIYPKTNSSSSLEISAVPHTYSIITEETDRLKVHLGNYRIDKTELKDKSQDDASMYRVMQTYCDRMATNTNPDKTLRKTVFRIKTSVEPQLVEEEKTEYTRDYKITKMHDMTSGEYIFTIEHNGAVNFDIVTGNSAIEATGITFDRMNVSVPLNGSVKLEPVITPANAGNRKAVWTSSDPSVASVDEAGMVRGLKSGEAKITATLKNGISAACNITVVDQSIKELVPSETNLTMNRGDKKTVSVTILPENSSQRELNWSSLDESVATVSDTGEITAVSAGSTQIRVSAAHYDVSALIQVTVDVDGLYTKIPQYTMTATASSEQNGSNEGPAANVLDGSMGTWWHTSWSPAASAPHYIDLTFGEKKLVNKYAYTPRTGAANGTITGYILYKQDADGKYTQTIATGSWTQDSQIKEVIFNTPVETTGIRLQVVSSVGGFGSAAEINVYEQGKITTVQDIADKITGLTVSRDNASLSLPSMTGYTFALASSDKQDVISLEGKVTAAYQDTTVMITLTVTKTEDNTSAVTKPIAVLVPGFVNPAADGVTLNKNLLSMKIGQTEKLSATLLLAERGDVITGFAPKDSKIVSVDANGTVTALAKGDTTITVTTKYGYTDTCEVVVDTDVIGASRKTLEKMISKAEAVKPGGYTQASFAALSEELAKAKKVYANQYAELLELTSAALNLQEKLDELVQVDTSALAGKIADAKAINKTPFTEESYNALLTAIEAAEKALTAVTSDQQVQEETAKLQKAIDALVKLVHVDTSALTGKIADAKAINKTSYTAESYNALLAAIEAAEKALTSVTSDQQVQEEAAKLQKAIDALVKKGSSGSDSGSSGSGSSSTPSTPAAPSTPDGSVTVSGGKADVTVKEGTPTISGTKAELVLTVPSGTLIKEAQSHTKENPLLVNVTVPTTQIREQLQKMDIQSIQASVTVPKEISSSQNIQINEIKLEAAVLSEAKQSNKTVSISVQDETGKQNYQWTFSPNTVYPVITKAASVNLAVTAAPVSSDAKIQSMLSSNATDQAKNGAVIRFAHSGLLTSPANVRVYVGDQAGCTPSSSLYLYYRNEKTGMLEAQSTKRFVVDAAGYVEFSIYHCSDYVLLPQQETNAYPVLSDTTLPFAMERGKQYTFKMTLTKAVTPSFSTGDSRVAVIKKVTKRNGEYYVTVEAVGTSGNATGIYSSLPSQGAVSHCIVAVK